MTESILVTGATGTVGRHVVAALSDRDVAIKTGVRDPGTVPKELADAREVVEFDFTKPETRGRALAALDESIARYRRTRRDIRLGHVVGVHWVENRRGVHHAGRILGERRSPHRYHAESVVAKSEGGPAGVYAGSGSAQRRYVIDIELTFQVQKGPSPSVGS